MIANESALIALSKGNDYITTEDVEDAIDSTMFKGNKRLHDKAKKDFDIICYHEAGHAVVHYLLGQPISRISVQGSTSGVGGFVLSEDSDNVLCSKADLKIQVMQAYGGRIAEELILGEDNVTTGASSDIDNATKLINDYVNEYGFNKSLVCWKSISNKNDGMIPNAELISSISKELEDETRQLLKDNLDLVYGLAEKLRAVETLSGEDAVSLLNCVIQNREDR
jgi:cell division protease FtsH